MAWSRIPATRAVDLLEQNGYIILGVGIWLPTHPGPTIPTPFVYDWSAERVADSANSAKTAGEFIRTFSWDESDQSRGQEPYFCLTAHLKDS